MSKRKTSLPPRFAIFLLCLCSISSCSSATSESNIGETFAEIAWNVIGVIRRIRHGSSAADAGEEDKESQLVLNDPRFLYETLYRFISIKNQIFFKVYIIFSYLISGMMTKMRSIVMEKPNAPISMATILCSGCGISLKLNTISTVSDEVIIFVLPLPLM